MIIIRDILKQLWMMQLKMKPVRNIIYFYKNISDAIVAAIHNRSKCIVADVRNSS